MEQMEMKQFVERYPWTFAKTYADRAPHEYYVKSELDPKGQEDFERFVIFIRENGFKAGFWGKIHIYYKLDGRYYWTMGDPIEETYILNRCDATEYIVENGEMRWKHGE